MGDKIRNPRTGRMVKRDGRIGRKIMAQPSCAAMYAQYKETCGLVPWDFNPCATVTDVERLKYYRDTYSDCTNYRLRHKKKCTDKSERGQIKAGHTHAINRMNKYRKQCSNKIRRLTGAPKKKSPPLQPLRKPQKKLEKKCDQESDNWYD